MDLCDRLASGHGPRCLRVRVLYRAALAVWLVTLLNYEVVERGMSLIVAARAPGFTTPPMMLGP